MNIRDRLNGALAEIPAIRDRANPATGRPRREDAPWFRQRQEYQAEVSRQEQARISARARVREDREREALERNWESEAMHSGRELAPPRTRGRIR